MPAAATAVATPPAAAGAEPIGQRAVALPRAGAAAWLELTKPRIVQLMLVTCVAAMMLAAGGVPELRLLAATCVGLALSIGGASAVNHVLDRDLDRRMTRTQWRPVASGAISPTAATLFGLALFTLGGAVLCLAVNPLTAWCGLFGGAFYVAVYTPLKRVSSHNTVVGGVAGAMPPLVGWAAVTGGLDSVLAWTLFAIMFTWQPAHFWPLSLLLRADYERAGFRMLPVTHGERATVRATWRWTWLAVATTLVPVVTGDVGVAYAVGAAAANVFLVRRMWALVRADRARGEGELLVGPIASAGRDAARGAFLGSLVWLALLFAALGLDALIG